MRFEGLDYFSFCFVYFQMTSDFKQMETGMSNLMARMENLSSFSLEINSRLQVICYVIKSLCEDIFYAYIKKFVQHYITNKHIVKQTLFSADEEKAEIIIKLQSV